MQLRIEMNDLQVYYTIERTFLRKGPKRAHRDCTILSAREKLCNAVACEIKEFQSCDATGDGVTSDLIASTRQLPYFSEILRAIRSGAKEADSPVISTVEDISCALLTHNKYTRNVKGNCVMEGGLALRFFFLLFEDLGNDTLMRFYKSSYIFRGESSYHSPGLEESARSLSLH